VEFWSDKLNGNKTRDSRTRDELIQAGWQVLIVWECELGDLAALEYRLQLFLGHAGAPANGTGVGPLRRQHGVDIDGRISDKVGICRTA